MSARFLSTLKRSTTLLGAFLLVASTLVFPVPAKAATANSIYSYTLTGDSSTVANGAAANSGVNLTLDGDWSQSAFGVHFAGDTVDEISVGYGRPGGGTDTINADADEAVGITTKLKYEGPGVNERCFPDSHNISQIGRFGEDLSQVKIQTSNCYDADWAVFPECRFAGADSTTADLPFPSRLQLVDGETYIIRCFKEPDPASGTTTATIEVTQVNTFYGNTTITDEYEITRTGTIQSTAYLSVANKYQLPTQENNTDQFVGDVAKVAVCQASTTAAVETCLETENPDPVVPTPEREWVTNPSVETDLAQWEGTYGGTPYVQVSRSNAQAHTGSYAIEVLGLAGASNHKSGVSDDNPKLVTSATLNEVYDGSVWVKPGAVGDQINFILREWDGSTLLTDNKVTHTATSTDWVQMTNSITGTMNGSRLSFAVYGQDVDADDVFYMDDMSLESVLVNHEWAQNASLETDLDHWDDLYSSSPYVTVAHSTDQAHTGTGSVLVSAGAGASNLTSGFSSDGWMLNGKTVESKSYTGSVWVKPSFVGQQIVLRMYEYTWNGASADEHGLVKVVHTATSTDWQKIEGTLTAATSGSGISFKVHGKAMYEGHSFYADDLSLTSVE